jgi:hypothetical protein
MNDLPKQVAALKEASGLALAEAFVRVGEGPYSETDLADAWRQGLSADAALHPGGWYDPPPHGITTLFGKAQDGFQRVCQPSFRPEPLWPRADHLHDPGDVIMVYASPVARASSLIGDFGLSLYRGPDRALVEHCEAVLRATLSIASHARPGMPFHDLYAFAMQQAAAQGFANRIESAVDSTGTNIGHTIPLSFSGDPTHAAIGQARSFAEIREALRTGRKFLNATETQRIEPTMAFTVEPRFSTATLPQTWFHLTVIFDGGTRSIHHGFAPLFRQQGMDRLLDLLS